MKKIFLALALMAFLMPSVQAQEVTQKELIKERKALTKLTTKELNERAGKVARKAAKAYEKEGWIVTPGQLPLEKQLDRAYNMQYEFDENQFPKYIMGEGQSIGENYDGAKMQASELAKLNLAGQVQTEITALIESTVANKQLQAEEAATITESVMASKNLISQSLGRLIPVVECYRTLGNRNKEVRVQVAYNSTMAMAAAKKVIREDLERKGQKLHDQLDKVMGFDNK